MKPARLSGRLAGLATLIFATVLGASCPNESQPAYLGTCKNNLAQVGKAIMGFENANNEMTPATLGDLSPRWINDPAVFRCPEAPARPLAKGEMFQIDYVYIGAVPASVSGAKTILVLDKPGNHPQSGLRNALYSDGHAASLTDAQVSQEFQRCLTDLKPWLDEQPTDVQKRIREFYQVVP